ncbi:MAG: DUF3040 domain-containing protein [Streptosporangiaceae bacterium]
MSLSARHRHALDAIETALAGSDPRLASMLNAFTRLAAGEDMPAPERTRPRPARAVSGRCFLGFRFPRESPRRRPRWQWPWLILWLAVSLAPITIAVVVARASTGGCAAPPAAACAGHAARQVVRHPAAHGAAGRQASHSHPPAGGSP